MHRVLWSLTAAAAVFTVSDPAAACFDPDEHGVSRTVACITSIHAGVVTGTFGTADALYGVDRAWLPTGWSVPQLVLGGFGLMGGGTATIVLAGTDDATAHRTTDVFWGAGLIALGGIHGAIATWSLEKHRSEPVDDLPPDFTVSVSPTVGGAVVSGTF